jgi:micrococcal nuclease
MYQYAIKEVVKVVDGDTVDVVIDLGFDITRKERVRLNGIDAPESITKDEVEKKYGMEAKEFVKKWFSENKNILIRTYKEEKYGRILGDFFTEGNKPLNILLVEQGYAWVYDGNTKSKDFSLLEEKRKSTSINISNK